MNLDFEAARAILYDEPEVNSFQASDYIPLKQAFDEKLIHDHTPAIAALFGDRRLVIPTLAVVYHHVVEGTFEGRPWMLTLCALCNAGAMFDPCVDGQPHRFAAQGYYEAMTLIADQETRSFWNHLTGICLHGKLAGKQLRRFGPVEQITAGQALTAYPDAVFIRVDSMSEQERATAEHWDQIYRRAAVPAWDDDEELIASLKLRQGRLPRYDMGLGIWTENTQRYYPILKIHEAQHSILDIIDGRKVLITMNQEIGLPTAFYTDADSAVFERGRVRLSNGQIYQHGFLFRDGQRVNAARPNHNVIRWYGFASLFPHCEIYGERKQNTAQSATS